MSDLAPQEDAKESSLAALKREARATLDSYAAFLNSPTYQHNVDIAVLTKIAGDDKVPTRERLRAAQVLAKLRLEAMAALAELSGTRLQMLRELGLQDTPAAAHFTQVNTKIEIVRADDWRAASADFVDAEGGPVEKAERDEPDDGPTAP